MTHTAPLPDKPLNREERRRLKHKRGIAVPAWGSGRLVSSAVIDKAEACRPLTEAETATAHAITALAWQALQEGSGTAADFDRIARVINVAKVRALEINEWLANELEKAQDAMTACKERYLKHGRFGFSGPELQVMRDAMAYQVEIVNSSSPEQLRRAYRAAQKVIDQQIKARSE